MKKTSVQTIVAAVKTVAEKTVAIVNAVLIDKANECGKAFAVAQFSATAAIDAFLDAIIAELGKGNVKAITSKDRSPYAALFAQAVEKNGGNAKSAKALLSMRAKVKGFPMNEKRQTAGNTSAVQRKGEKVVGKAQSSTDEENLLDMHDEKKAVDNLKTIFRAIKAAHGDGSKAIIDAAMKAAGIA